MTHTVLMKTHTVTNVVTSTPISIIMVIPIIPIKKSRPKQSSSLNTTGTLTSFYPTVTMSSLKTISSRITQPGRIFTTEGDSPTASPSSSTAIPSVVVPSPAYQSKVVGSTAPSQNHLSSGAIAGIVIGILAYVTLAVWITIRVTKFYKRRQRDHPKIEGFRRMSDTESVLSSADNVEIHQQIPSQAIPGVVLGDHEVARSRYKGVGRSASCQTGDV
ncbi:hypothetical protein AMATHDRAFT_5802 [Amanita thiersii Skay4041]|uniref:Uncharacterized protein n=1 Tax=Amanita thiersii Skay4041 TaxID=703135 RepID=A0A2A9NL36_9AGAR|nr:hypothetical protein AMATHDRAFT_5802 [Amanita thiersii Skay4041]